MRLTASSVTSLARRQKGHSHFVSPHIPPWGCVSSEKFDPGSVTDELNDQVTKQVWFFTVTRPGDQVDVDDTVVIYQRVSFPPAGKEADFTVTPRVRPTSERACPSLVTLIQSNAMVLYVNPHAVITVFHCGIKGHVTQRNRREGSSAMVLTGRSHTCSIVIVR